MTREQEKVIKANKYYLLHLNQHQNLVHYISNVTLLSPDNKKARPWLCSQDLSTKSLFCMEPSIRRSDLCFSLSPRARPVFKSEQGFPRRKNVICLSFSRIKKFYSSGEKKMKMCENTTFQKYSKNNRRIRNWPKYIFPCF